MNSTHIDDSGAGRLPVYSGAETLIDPSSATQDLEAMKVFLRRTRTAEYYKTETSWTRKLNEARDFGTGVRALAVARSEGVHEYELVLSFGDPAYDLVVPGEPAERPEAPGKAEWW